MSFPGLILILAVILFIIGGITLHWLLIAGAIAVVLYLVVGPLGVGSARTGGVRTRRYW